MPKFKSKSSWKKRAKFTATGKIKRGKAYRSHLLNSKTTKRKRQLRKSTFAHVSNAITIKSMIPYKRKGRK